MRGNRYSGKPGDAREVVAAELEASGADQRRRKWEQTKRTRRSRVVAGCTAVLLTVVAFVSACGSNDKPEAPTSTSTSTSPAGPQPNVEPTTKSIDPNGGNLFTPEIKAPPAPTEPPGVHRNN